VEEYYRAGQATDDNVAHAMHAGYLSLYTHTHTEYVILNAFPLQQWLYEHAPLLHYTYIACVV